jgi:hypothetical protein
MVISNDNPILPKEGGFYKAKQQHMMFNQKLSHKLSILLSQPIGK